MPGRNGTGPFGRGPVTGRGLGRSGQRGGIGAGPAGYCLCPKCGEITNHTTGVPCTSTKCPKCGEAMIRG